MNINYYFIPLFFLCLFDIIFVNGGLIMSSEFVEKDSKVGYIVTIVILSFIVIGLSGYIVYDKYFIQDECSVVDKEESEAPSDDDSWC